MKLNSLLSIDASNLNEIIKPITTLINTAVPVLLTLVGSIGLIWCIVLGVRYAKSEDPQEHEKAKKADRGPRHVRQSGTRPLEVSATRRHT